MSEPIQWSQLFSPSPGPGPEYKEPRQPLKCQLCGRFTKTLTLVWTGGPEPEPDYEVGDCCR